MSKFVLSKAMGSIPDEMLQEAMTIKKNTGRKWIIRAAACAAMLALLIGAMLFGDGTGEKASFISVIVYADGENGVELKLPDQNSAVSYVKDEYLGYYSSGPSTDEDKTHFYFGIRLNEYERQYTDYKVYKNGKEVEKGKRIDDLWAATTWSVTEFDDRGYPYKQGWQTTVTGYTEEKIEIEIHYLKERGDLLLSCKISVTPQEEGFLIVLEEVYVPEA